MNKSQKIAVLILLGIFSSMTQVLAQEPQMSADHIMVMPEAIKWGAPPPGLPPGAQVAVLDGDPTMAGLFTIRLKIPANYAVKPHTHPTDEHITVLEGSGYMGMGATYDEKTAKNLMPGSFVVMKTGTIHYLYTKKPCIVQIHGMGPFAINYI